MRWPVDEFERRVLSSGVIAETEWRLFRQRTAAKLPHAESTQLAQSAVRSGLLTSWLAPIQTASPP